jgi:hypothetical protein
MLTKYQVKEYEVDGTSPHSEKVGNTYKTLTGKSENKRKPEGPRHGMSLTRYVVSKYSVQV